jgi:isoamylase
MQPGSPGPAGAHCDRDGVNFTLYSAGATAVELCLFDHDGRATARHFLPQQTAGTWHGYLPGCRPGQRYAYRVHGPWSPAEGLRFNPAKLLLDPYARQLDGAFRWDPALFDFLPGGEDDGWRKNEQDSAACVPRCIVTAASAAAPIRRPSIPWPELVIYEANVRGFTMRHPGVAEAERGTFRGLANRHILDYLKALGITALELMPVHALIDEAFLARRGLRNYWGYNSVQFFVPDGRFGRGDAVSEFRDMVRAIHDAGIEVILDVAYNHTGESDERGPTLSFRGIDNLCYYRSQPDDPGRLANDSGCGNSLNSDHPAVQALVLDSLCYWHRDMGVDGFRFDLATVLGRSQHGFDGAHPLLQRIGSHPDLRHARLIAEPWDAGPGGYQLGRFPPRWAEWNDRYRDTVRRLWRGDADQLAEFARRIHGSADLFEGNGRAPASSINFVTSHDGFTLQDLVSYARRHNQANGEHNRDGHPHNFSSNHGVEGASDEPSVARARERHRLNLLATLLFSQGTPMLLAGDEFGHSQGGNNNAYAQDNDTGWLDWRLAQSKQAFLQQVRALLALRRELPLLRLPHYLHGGSNATPCGPDIQWLRADGLPMQAHDWHGTPRFTLLLARQADDTDHAADGQAVALLFNAAAGACAFTLPRCAAARHWQLRFASSATPPPSHGPTSWQLTGWSLALLQLGS